MLKADFYPYILNFKEPGGTSRGVMTQRKVWYIYIYDEANPMVQGVGECAPLPGLSCDDMKKYEQILHDVCTNVSEYVSNLTLLTPFPSIRFGLEMAWLDYRHGGQRRWFPSDFTDGKDAIRINGLIWMGNKEMMIKRIRMKLRKGFSCLKLKIGAIHFDDEYQILKDLRRKFSSFDLELRVDANGAFKFDEALQRIDQLSKLHIHSIEQPIKAGQIEKMAAICCRASVPVALDEEIIGIHTYQQRDELLSVIMPQYIILKPSLIGGFHSSDEWISLAEKYRVGWWITSALESNIGLNALAQWTYTKSSHMPQGLGTGQVFTNNMPSQLKLAGEYLYLNPNGKLRSELKYLQSAKR